MSSGRKVSTNFAVFIISFLVFTTIVVFAVMLFLSYENMHNNLIISNKDETEFIAMDLVRDCMQLSGEQPFTFTVDDDGTRNFQVSSMIVKFVDSEIYKRNASIYLTDRDGMILCRNQLIGDGTNQFKAEKRDNGRYYITDITALELIKEAVAGEMSAADDSTAGYVVSSRCIRIPNSDYYCLVKRLADTNTVKSEYISIILLPAIIAMLISIVLYVAFVWLSLEPVKEISNVISRVAEGDFKARVSTKYTDEEEGTGFTLSSEFSQMGSTVNNMIESLENQEKDRELFISSIAHDIRTPLTSINGFVTAMLYEPHQAGDRPYQTTCCLDDGSIIPGTS